MAQLRVRWQDAQGGQPSVVAVHGEPGIGKTALVHAFLRELPAGTPLLLASGDESERVLAYGVVDQLVPPSQRTERLDAAVLSRPPADPLTVGAALVEQLGVLQERGPLLLVVDDLHWADGASLQAIGFALRRLRVDQVLALLTLRDPGDARVPAVLQRVIDGPAGVRIGLHGLAPEDLQRLALDHGWESLGSALAERLHGHTGGNPLYATALLDELDPDALRSLDQGLLPAPRGFSTLVLDRLSTCPPDTGRLLAAAAAQGERVLLADAHAVAGVSDPLSAVEPAVTSRLIRMRSSRDGKELEFVHPLVRAAVYHALDAPERRELHERAVPQAASELEATHHRLSAAALPDEQLASDAERLAGDVAAQGMWRASAELLLRAASVTPARVDRQRRVLEAIEALLLEGDLSEARVCARGLDAFDDTPRLRYIRGRLAHARGDLPAAKTHMTSAWEAVRDTVDPQVAARIAGQLAAIHINSGAASEGAAWAERCLAAEPQAGPATATVRALRLFALAASGRPEEALQVALDPPPGAMLSVADADDLLGRGVVRLWTDQLDGALADLGRVIDTVRHTGPFHLRVIASFYRADAMHRAGHLADAAAAADHAATAARDGEQVWMLGLAASVASWCHASLGAWEPAEAAADEAVRSAELLGDMASRMWAATALGRLARARSDPAAQVDAVGRVLELSGAAGADEPGIQPWRELLVEGLLGIDALDEAEKHLAPLRIRADERGLRSVQAAAARLHGTLAAARGRTDEAEKAFSSAYAHLEAAPSSRPFELALVERAHARALRGDPRAHRLMMTARERFASIGAAPFAASCAIGDGEDDRAGGVAQLTATERTVAHLAGKGRTNREIASDLVVSVKTVEFHLSNIYAKLGLRSRTELAARLHEDLS